MQLVSNNSILVNCIALAAAPACCMTAYLVCSKLPCLDQRSYVLYGGHNVLLGAVAQSKTEQKLGVAQCLLLRPATAAALSGIMKEKQASMAHDDAPGAPPVYRIQQFGGQAGALAYHLQPNPLCLERVELAAKDTLNQTEQEGYLRRGP